MSRDPLAIGELVAGGLAVTLAPQLLAGRLADVAMVPLDQGPRRALYALTAASGARPPAREFVAALGHAFEQPSNTLPRRRE